MGTEVGCKNRALCSSQMQTPTADPGKRGKTRRWTGAERRGTGKEHRASPQFVASFICTILVYQQIVHPKFLVIFPGIPFSEVIKLRIRGFRARKNSCRMCHYEVKCRKELWLLARARHCGLIVNGRSQANGDFFLLKKYQLLLSPLRSPRSNKVVWGLESRQI